MSVLLLINEQRLYEAELTVSYLIFSNCVSSTRLRYRSVLTLNWNGRRKTLFRIVLCLNSPPALYKSRWTICFESLFISHLAKADLDCHHTQDGAHSLPLNGSFPAHRTRYSESFSLRISNALNHELLYDCWWVVWRRVVREVENRGIPLKIWRSEGWLASIKIQFIILGLQPHDQIVPRNCGRKDCMLTRFSLVIKLEISNQIFFPNISYIFYKIKL